MFSKHRIEALSDAVFAIAMTLLILDIKPPGEGDPAGLGHALRHQVPEWISFAVSFALTSLFWTFQHRVFDVLEKVGRESLLLTFTFLGFVTVLPFTTALWGRHITAPLAFSIYFLNQCFIAAALAAKLEWARTHGHVLAVPDASLMRIRLWFLCGLFAYAAAICQVLPLVYLWAAVLPVAFLGRFLRNRHKRKSAVGQAAPASY